MNKHDFISALEKAGAVQINGGSLTCQFNVLSNGGLLVRWNGVDGYQELTVSCEALNKASIEGHKATVVIGDKPLTIALYDLTPALVTPHSTFEDWERLIGQATVLGLISKVAINGVLDSFFDEFAPDGQRQKPLRDRFCEAWEKSGGDREAMIEGLAVRFSRTTKVDREKWRSLLSVADTLIGLMAAGSRVSD